MNSVQVVSELRENLSELKSKGIEEIRIVNLEAYLKVVEKSIDDSKIEGERHREEALKKMELDTEIWRVRAELESNHNLEMFRSVTEAGGTALKSATLVNGGAAIALLAFLGNLMTKIPDEKLVLVEELNYAMLIFVFGVGSAALATAARYLAQAYYSESSMKVGNGFKWLAIFLALASFAAFFCGGITAYLGITK